ncbi:MAG: YHYH protein, partial [Myxococcales bacterium]|nr:YHYH protein [Myxococcales bacterium]
MNEPTISPSSSHGTRPFDARLALVRAACLLPALVAAASVACGEVTSVPGDDASTEAGSPPVDAAPGEDGDSLAPPGADAAPLDHCAAIAASVTEAGFGATVGVRCDSEYAYISGDTYPTHAKMDGITGTNDQVPVPAPGYVSPIRLAPKVAAKPTTIDAALGVAVNGVPIYDYSSQGALDPSVYDPKFDTKATGELDVCNGHSGRGDDYHYHAAPTCMMAAMKNAGPRAIL